MTEWVTCNSGRVDQMVTEVGSALDGRWRKFLALLRDGAARRIVMEHRDRFARFGCEYVAAAQGRALVVVDPAEVDDDLVGDVPEILTLLYARLYGRSAASRAAKTVVAATGGAP